MLSTSSLSNAYTVRRCGWHWKQATSFTFQEALLRASGIVKRDEIIIKKKWSAVLGVKVVSEIIIKVHKSIFSALHIVWGLHCSSLTVEG